MKTEIEKRASKFIDETDMMQFSTMEIMVMFAEKELEAINYTHCCTELRDEYLQPELDKYKNIKIEQTKSQSDSEQLNCKHEYRPFGLKQSERESWCIKCGKKYSFTG